MNNTRPSVLIVDDTAIMQDILADILDEIGFDIVGLANNGKEAYEKYKELNPNIVTMDLNMPIMDGEQSSKKILEYDNKAKVLMVSAHSQSRIKQDIMAHGLTGYITKPFEKQKIIDEVKSLNII